MENYTYRLSYAYPTSPNAEQYNLGLYGCYLLEYKGPLGDKHIKVERDRACIDKEVERLIEIGMTPDRWCITHELLSHRICGH